MSRPGVAVSPPDGKTGHDRPGAEPQRSGANPYGRSLIGWLADTARRFRADVAGAVAIMVVLMTPVMIGFMGISVDVSVWYTVRRIMQNAADAAAMAAASELANGESNSWANSAANNAADANGMDKWGDETVSIAYSNDSPSNVTVTITRPLPLLFSTLFLDTSPNASVEATATLEFIDEFCILGLDPSATNAVTVSGSGTADLDCGIAVNSNDSCAFNAAGSSTTNVTTVSTVGGYCEGASATVNDQAPPRIGPAVSDPYAGLEVSNITNYTPGDCDEGNIGFGPMNSPSGDTTYDAASNGGVYVFCRGLKITGNIMVDFTPGIYIIDDGDLQIGGTGATSLSVSGNGVTFVVTNSAKYASTGASDGEFSIAGNADIDFTAPTSDHANWPDSSGILFYQDRNISTAAAQNNNITGATNITMDGAIYTPNNQLNFSGNASGGGDGCALLIGKTVNIGGSTAVGSNCNTAGTPDMGRYKPKLAG